MDKKKEIHVPERELIAAANEGMDEFIGVFVKHIRKVVGDELTAETMPLLTGEQITLFGYDILRDELMNGGFIQLIHNGYGPFFFDNPFAKAMRLWGAKDFSKLIYKAKELYEVKKHELTTDCTDEEFMALFELHPEFDDLDDVFIEAEEGITATIASYIDQHLELFAVIDKD
ncbi:MAG: DMP19 family protein [Bacteroidaceae bacterium]